ncbi:MAG TPA: hypothetical protein VFC44_03575 [Candidatus Saccharimonadales bacterium]|nr:hypothetical protein [Candidatus Saccharimonadales bacterium]
MSGALSKGMVITAACGIIAVLLGVAVLFAELFGTVFRDKEMPMVICINAGVASLAFFLAFVIAACVFKPGARLIISCAAIWVVIAGAVLWIEQRP